MVVKADPANSGAVGMDSLEAIYVAEITRLASLGTILTGDAAAGGGPRA